MSVEAGPSKVYFNKRNYIMQATNLFWWKKKIQSNIRYYDNENANHCNNRVHVCNKRIDKYKYAKPIVYFLAFQYSDSSMYVKALPSQANI